VRLVRGADDGNGPHPAEGIGDEFIGGIHGGRG
jgi:hypothetical protein